MENGDPAVKGPTQAAPATYRMQLFVVGNEPNSQAARQNLKRLCDEHLGGDAEVEIVDVLKEYQRALDNQVLVAPTLIVQVGDRRIMIAGTLKNTPVVLAALQPEEGT